MRILLRNLVTLMNNTYTKGAAVRYASNAPKKEPPLPPTEEKLTEEVKKNLVVEKFGGITTISINRQKKRNCLNEATLRELAAALDAFDKDPGGRVLVLSGEGGSFSAGFDLHEIADKGYMTLKDAASRLMHRPLCEKPTVAAVSGWAVGEGFELALACDLRVIEDTAVMGFLGRRFGVPTSLQGAARVTALVGLSRALDLLMSGRCVGGAEAHAMGLAAKLTATGTALGESIKLAKCLCKFPGAALGMDKLEAVSSQLNPNCEESMRHEAIRQSLLGSALEDMTRGADSFRRHGIGRHGKFYKLTETPLKEWEIEHSTEETTVTQETTDTKPPGPGTGKGGKQ